MSSRYFTNIMIILMGGFIVVVSQSFSPGVLGWVAFGVGVAMLCVTALAQLDRSRGLLQRMLDALALADVGLLIAFSLASSGTATTWLAFAFAIGVVVIGVVGTAIHEVATWRAQHRLGDLRWLHAGSSGATHPESRAA